MPLVILNGREDYLFALKQEWETYLHIQKQITEVDGQIKKLLEDIIEKDENKKQHVADKKPLNERTRRTTAINATARKLAVIIWNMLVKTQNYNPPSQYLFLDEKRRLGLVKRIRKQINKFEIQPEQLGFANT
jgi:hypothetical protein